jgi:signal transduction histidine kinase
MLGDVVGRLRLPRRTVRLRLTLIYGGLFLLSGIVLLTILYLLLSARTNHLVLFKLDGARLQDVQEIQELRTRMLGMRGPRRETSLENELLLQSGIALAITSLVSIGLGWFVAGRVLAPLRTMTASTRRISHENLHERLALEGPSDELKDLADTIDELLARLEAAFDAQRRFVANASHELRTPLAMMRTSLDVAAGKPGPRPAQVTSLDAKLREGLDQADRLLEGFLALSRAQHGDLADVTPVSLREVVSEAVAARGEAIAERRVEVEQAVAGDAFVRGSRTLLAQLVANLVDNGIRHNEPGGWMRIETSSGREDDVVALAVHTSGPLLDARRVAELTQPFRRLGAERTGSERGVGLGLSIVAAIARAHGGAVELRARGEGGLSVLVELPRAVESGSTDDGDPVPASDAMPHAAREPGGAAASGAASAEDEARA